MKVSFQRHTSRRSLAHFLVRDPTVRQCPQANTLQGRPAQGYFSRLRTSWYTLLEIYGNAPGMGRQFFLSCTDILKYH